MRLNTNHQGMGQLSASLNYSQHSLLHTIGILFLETTQGTFLRAIMASMQPAIKSE